MTKPKPKTPQRKDEVMRFRVDEKLMSGVDALAKSLDRSHSWIVRKAVEEFIERNSTKTNR